MRNVKSIILVCLMLISGGVLMAQKNSDVKGIWEFVAQEAPYEYSKGDLVIRQEGKEMKGEIVFGNDYKVSLHEVKYLDNVLTFKAYVEGEAIQVKNEVIRDEMKGEVKYSEGTLKLTAKRKK